MLFSNWDVYSIVLFVGCVGHEHNVERIFRGTLNSQNKKEERSAAEPRRSRVCQLFWVSLKYLPCLESSSLRSQTNAAFHKRNKSVVMFCTRWGTWGDFYETHANVTPRMPQPSSQQRMAPKFVWFKLSGVFIEIYMRAAFLVRAKEGAQWRWGICVRFLKVRAERVGEKQRKLLPWPGLWWRSHGKEVS